MYSFQKLCPVCCANVICMVHYEVCWPLGSASTGRAPKQLTGSPFKYLKAFIRKETGFTHLPPGLLKGLVNACNKSYEK